VTDRPDTVRAFVALEIPDRVREILRREQEALKAALPRARWTRPEGQHLTLKFLGETPTRRLPDLVMAIAAEVSGLAAVEVELSGAGFFPNPRRPRVAWLGGSADGGPEAAAAVERAAVSASFPADRRPWSLHLTQARIDRGWPRNAIERFLDWGRTVRIDRFSCPEVVLFRSDLRPGGAVYTALERISLG
jgi:2'-5' RNA ligase